MSETTEVALVSFKELREIATTMSKSGMFGKNPDQMLSLMLIAQAEGLHPAIAAMEYDVIQGRPALRGQAALARFQQAGGVVNWIVRTDAEAKAEFIPPKGKPLTVSWTMEKAKRMGLAGKDNWNKQPGVMLTWRCVAEGIRAVFPACLNRMYLAEEVQDFEPMRNVTPASDTPATEGDTVKVTLIPTETASEPETDWTAKASELTAKYGIDPKSKVALWKDAGCNAKAYCEMVEKVMAKPAPTTDAEPAHQGAPEGNGDLFGDPIQDLYVELENWLEDTSLPSLMREDIRATLESGEKDVGKLTALIAKVKDAAGK
jgi:hypothetical protein